MADRTTETEITFSRPFWLSCSAVPLEAGTYRLIVDEEEIEGLSFTAFRKTSIQLETPAIATSTGSKQRLTVSWEEIEKALAQDTEKVD